MEKLGLFNLIINFNSRIFLILQKNYIYEEVVLTSSFISLLHAQKPP